jgi:hypothetical protein
MGDAGNEYDFNPPSEPESARRRTPGPAPVRRNACEQWLKNRLSSRPAQLSKLRKDAESEGYSAETLYSAKEVLGIKEFPNGGGKWWRLPGGNESDGIARDDGSGAVGAA